MRTISAIAAAIVCAVICAPLFAVLSEMTILPLFYATSMEGTVAWSAVYVAGPVGLVSGAILGAWLVLRSGNGDNQPTRPLRINWDDNE